MKSNEKELSLSLIRCVATVFIVICHILKYYGSCFAYWFDVGVPIFFTLSGFLYGKKNVDNAIDFYIKQAKKILIPYYVYIAIVICLYMGFSKATISLRGLLELLTCSGTIDGLQHLWFVPYILICYFFTPILDSLKEKLKYSGLVRIVIVGCAVIFLYSIYQVLFDSYFRGDRILGFFAGYFCAIIIEKYGFKTAKYLSVIAGIVAIPLNLIYILIKYRLEFDSPIYETLFNYLAFYSHACLGVFIFLFMYVVFQGVKKHKILEISDEYSYYVYLTHRPFIMGPLSILALIPFAGLNILVMLLAMCGCTVVVYKITCVIKEKTSVSINKP